MSNFKSFFTILGLILFLGLSLRAQGQPLAVYSNQQPEGFYTHSEGQSWQALFLPPRSAHDFRLTAQGKVVYQDSHFDWYALDLKSRKTQLLAKDKIFSPGFIEILPVQRSDGSYYAKRILPYGLEIYRIKDQKAIPFLKKPGLYDFQPLPDGSYAYVLWSGRGQESPDFADFIPGQTMQLWHKPLSGNARLLGKFDTVLGLQVAARTQLLFFTPGHKQGKRSWRLMAVDISQKQTRPLADIPQSDSRGYPDLLAWPQNDWIVYPEAMVPHAVDHMPQPFIRQHVPSGARHALGTLSALVRKKGQGTPGHVTSVVYGPEGSPSHTLVTHSLETGEIIDRHPYLWRTLSPEYAMYLYP